MLRFGIHGYNTEPENNLRNLIKKSIYKRFSYQTVMWEFISSKTGFIHNNDEPAGYIEIWISDDKYLTTILSQFEKNNLHETLEITSPRYPALLITAEEIKNGTWRSNLKKPFSLLNFWVIAGASLALVNIIIIFILVSLY